MQQENQGIVGSRLTFGKVETEKEREAKMAGLMSWKELTEKDRVKYPERYNRDPHEDYIADVGDALEQY